MEHLHQPSSGIGSGVTLLTIGVLVLLIGILIWLISQKKLSFTGPNPKDRKTFSGEQREILSLIKDRGEPVEQTEIIHIIFGDLGYGEEILKDMESRNLIHREWNPRKRTYLISSK
ncbi:hypothetical protein KGY73_00750 [bacterium]|nr:hypothetical protein [bacterium]